MAVSSRNKSDGDTMMHELTAFQIRQEMAGSHPQIRHGQRPWVMSLGSLSEPHKKLSLPAEDWSDYLTEGVLRAVPNSLTACFEVNELCFVTEGKTSGKDLEHMRTTCNRRFHRVWNWCEHWVRQPVWGRHRDSVKYNFNFPTGTVLISADKDLQQQVASELDPVFFEHFGFLHYPGSGAGFYLSWEHGATVSVAFRGKYMEHFQPTRVSMQKVADALSILLQEPRVS